MAARKLIDDRCVIPQSALLGGDRRYAYKAGRCMTLAELRQAAACYPHATPGVPDSAYAYPITRAGTPPKTCAPRRLLWAKGPKHAGLAGVTPYTSEEFQERLSEARENPNRFKPAVDRIRETAEQLLREGAGWSDRKVFISDVADRMGLSTKRIAGLLLIGNNRGWINLVRADLAGRAGGETAEKARASEIEPPTGGHVHFIQFDKPMGPPPKQRVQEAEHIKANPNEDTGSRLIVIQDDLYESKSKDPTAWNALADRFDRLALKAPYPEPLRDRARECRSQAAKWK